MTPRSMDKTASRVSDERLAQMLESARRLEISEWVSVFSELQSLRSLSSDSVSDGSKGMMVKPLVWHAQDTGNRSAGWQAEDILLGIRYFVSDDGRWCSNVYTKWRDAGSVEEAKAAAEADYERRILSALDNGTGGRQPVAWQGLSITTEKLVDDFASALKTKLRAAELKYGYDDGWRGEDWETKCRRDLLRHVLKGDPLDVAAYAAFCWHHQWPTTPTPLDVAHFQLVALPPLYPSPTEPKAGVVSYSLADCKRLVEVVIEHCQGPDWDCDTKAAVKSLYAALNGDKP